VPTQSKAWPTPIRPSVAHRPLTVRAERRSLTAAVLPPHCSSYALCPSLGVSVALRGVRERDPTDLLSLRSRTSTAPLHSPIHPPHLHLQQLHAASPPRTTATTSHSHHRTFFFSPRGFSPSPVQPVFFFQRRFHPPWCVVDAVFRATISARVPLRLSPPRLNNCVVS
jgi:hypothetical protein